MKDKRTYLDRAEYIKKAVNKRRRAIRKRAVDYKGGKCQICSYDRFSGALDFHHIDPAKKNFAISVDGMTRSWDKVKREIDKCLLICANCHREIHGGITQLPTVTSVET